MIYSVIIKPEAEEELLEALDWYDKQRAGLGAALYEEVL